MRRSPDVEQPERERLGRLDRDLHPAHVGDPRQHRLHHVVVAHADAAAGDDGVARRRRPRAASPRARPRRRGRRRDRWPRNRPRRPAATTSSCCSRGSGRAATREPSSINSSPVDSTATRGVRNTAHTSGVDAGQHAGDGRANRPCPRGTPRCRPARRRRRRGSTRPASTDLLIEHVRRRRRSVSSTITDASAPAGIGAPVMMRIASPASDDAIGRPAGGDLGDDVQLDRCVRRCRRHEPRSRRPRGWRTAARPRRRPRARRARAPTASAIDTSTTSHDDTTIEHVVAGLAFADHRPERYRFVSEQLHPRSSRQRPHGAAGRAWDGDDVEVTDVPLGERGVDDQRSGRPRTCAVRACGCRRRGRFASSCCSATSTSPTCGSAPTARPLGRDERRSPHRARRLLRHRPGVHAVHQHAADPTAAAARRRQRGASDRDGRRRDARRACRSTSVHAARHASMARSTTPTTPSSSTSTVTAW